MEAQWRNELEALQHLLASQQSQIDALQKQVGGSAPAATEDVDLPAAEYNRNFFCTGALCVWVCVSMFVSGFGNGVEGNLGQIMSLLWPICWTMLYGMILGTGDSSRAGRRAVLHLRIFIAMQIPLAPFAMWASGRREDAVLMFFVMSICVIFWPWLGNSMIAVLRKRESLISQAEFYSNRALKLAGFQILLVVFACAMGIDGSKTYDRVYATEVFSLTLVFTWIYLVAIFDIAQVDGRAATKLRLTPLQAAAIILIGVNVLSGLAAYIMSGQKRPSRRAVFVVAYTMMISGNFALIPVGRLVWIARYHPGRASSKSSAASVKPVDALGSLGLAGA